MTSGVVLSLDRILPRDESKSSLVESLGEVECEMPEAELVDRRCSRDPDELLVSMVFELLDIRRSGEEEGTTRVNKRRRFLSERERKKKKKERSIATKEQNFTQQGLPI